MTEDTQKMLVRFTQEQTAYTPLSPTSGAACANCRWFINQSDMGQGCHIIENYPADVLPTGYCNRHDLLPSFEPEPLQVELVGIGERALGDNPHIPQDYVDRLEHEQPESLYATPDSNDTGVLKTLVSRFKRGLKPGQSVIKAADGRRFMFIVTSNSYQDREQETITSTALKEYVDRAWKADDLFAGNNPLLFWHDDRLVAGQIVWAKMSGPFLLELAQEAPNPIAKAMFDYREANPNEKWGASHRFGYYKSDRDADGTYRRIFKQETSMLPREAAANLLTFSGVFPMDKKNEYLNKMLGLDNAAELLDKGVEAVVEAMAAAGLQHKSADAPVATEPAGIDLVALSKAFVQVVEDVADLSNDLDAAKKDYTDKAAALDSERVTAADALKAMQTELDTLKAQLDARPRSASRAGETVIEGEAAKGLEQLNVEKHPVLGALRPK